MSKRPPYDPDTPSSAGTRSDPTGAAEAAVSSLSAPIRTSRRRLLSVGTVGAIALVATACSDETPTPETAPGGGDDSDGGGGADDNPGADLTLATTAVSLELLAVATYDTVVQARDDGRLGLVPQALGELVDTVRAHHVAHRDAWSDLAGTDTPEASPVLAPMEASFAQQASELADAGGLARLVVTVEQTLADTYFIVIPSLSTDSVLRLAATMQPIDSQHAAIARFMLGEYPVPEAFSEGALAFGGGGG